MDKPKSYIANCYVVSSERDSSKHLFSNEVSGISCCLNGYAIIPLEDYYKLKNKRMPKEEVKKINAFDKELKQ